MNLDRVKKILQCLAEGSDPYTGVSLPSDSVYHNPNTVRALYTALRALDEMKAREEAGLSATPSMPQPKPATSASFQDAPNSSRLWDKGEDRKLKDGFRSGQTAEELATAHGRTVGSITARLVYLGLVSAPGHKFS